MDDFLTVRLFSGLVVGYSGLVIPIYIGVRLQLKYSYYRPIRQRRAQIRASVIAHWQARYKDLTVFLDHVLVEHLRVVGKYDDVENKRFTYTTIAFYALSALMFFGATALMSVNEQFLVKHAAILAISLSVVCLFQILSLAMIIFANYYEFSYYKTLEELSDFVNANGKAIEKPSLSDTQPEVA